MSEDDHDIVSAKPPDGQGAVPAKTPTLKERYGTIDRLLAEYEQEIVRGTAHQRALAEMLRSMAQRGKAKGAA